MTETPGARSMELFFIDGRPDGMLTAEVFNWTGHVLLAPRTRLPAALARPEARHTGVYLLLGEREGEPTAYIGEAEDMAGRIRSHDQAKDWWTQVAFVTTASNALNKAHVRYLEARLIEEAGRAGRSRLDNATTPARPGLSEAARANMEAFLGYLMMVLPAIRVDLFESGRRPAPAPHSSVSGNLNTAVGVPMDPAARELPPPPEPVVTANPTAVFRLRSSKHNITATAHLINGEFVVLKGSQAPMTWVGKEARPPASYLSRHAEVVRAGVLQPAGELGVFVENYAFKSPAEAASVVLARAGASMDWREVSTGQMFNDWLRNWEAGQLPSSDRHA